VLKPAGSRNWVEHVRGEENDALRRKVGMPTSTRTVQPTQFLSGFVGKKEEFSTSSSKVLILPEKENESDRCVNKK